MRCDEDVIQPMFLAECDDTNVCDINGWFSCCSVFAVDECHLDNMRYSTFYSFLYGAVASIDGGGGVSPGKCDTVQLSLGRNSLIQMNEVVNCQPEN